ncbi:QWRF motif-containing protein 3-like [Vigna unguiculata]|uniref:QWRF motif-containing protein 3-like n=1 Tax=Vigna unguiculata TaxID=3917 RepID=UPI001016BBC5|nr:QWRF motif-containing protein 3-like [Vigna unguiculata]
MKSDSNGSVSPYSPKPRTRFVSSRFMSSNSTASPEPGSGSPLGRFNRLARKDSTTLADHIGNERLKEREEQHHHQNQKPTNRTGSVFSALTKQRSCREFRNNTNGYGLEENNQDRDRDVVGRTTKNGVSGKSSPSPSPVVKKASSYLDPARHSLDENTFKGNFLCAKNSIDSESENTSLDSVPLQRTLSSRKLGREVSSKYMAACGRRGEASDSDPLSFDDSWMMKKYITQKAVKKANSLIGYMSSKSQWALSPGRSGSPPLSFESKDKPLSFSSLKPPHKRVEKILSMGLDLFRTKKSFSTTEVVHQLRLLHNRLIQWRFANARAHTVNQSMSLQAESNLINVSDGLTKLRHSVMQKKIQVEREKLKMKLNFVLHSQMKLLETWVCMERQHLGAITTLKECLHYVICKVPLLEGAKVDIQLASIAQRYASDLTDSIMSVLSGFSPLVCLVTH